MSGELMALYIHRLLMHAAFVVAGVFTVVFVYKYFHDSLWAVLTVFGSMYFLTALLTPLSGKLLSHLGLRTLIVLALPFSSVGVLALYHLSVNPGGEPLVWVMVVFVVCSALYRAFYWLPYQVDMTRLIDRGHRGSQVALLMSVADVNVVVMPFWGGLIVAQYGFDALFILSLLLTMAALLPLMYIQNHFEEYSWGFMQSFRELFSAKHRPLFAAYVGDGAQSAAQVIVWPLFVFLLLDQEYVALGAITALTFLAVMCLQFTVGHLFDSGHKKRVLWWGAVFSASGWFLRLFVATPLGIFVVDTYHGVGQSVNRMTIDAMTYEQAADNGRYIDEYTALKEIGLNLGRTFCLLVVAMGAYVGGIPIGFAAGILVAAIATLYTARLNERVCL
ncbi:MAG: MFS transporter [Patescibacteria group bacterium]